VNAAAWRDPERWRALVAERAPGLTVATRVLSTREILDGVRDASLDAGLVRCPPPRADGIEARPLRLEPQGVLVREDDPLAGAEVVTLPDLRERALLMHPRDANPGHYDAIVALCRDAGFEPRIVLRDLVIDLAYSSVASGSAVAIVGESSRAGLPAGLAWRPLAPPVALETGLVVRALNRGPAVERLIGVASEIAADLGWLPAS
jgi:DNA-binding transcriptional LysR family regulator